MSEILDESRVREKNEITIPIRVRDFLKIGPNDMIRWEVNDSGCVVVCKVVTRKVNNRCCRNDFEGGVGENGEKGSG